jgi:CheY-like chemotaxis protein
MWPGVGQKVDRLSREEFLRHLRTALGHLYDANRLRQNPLTDYFGLGRRFDASTLLRTALIDGIAALKPRPDDPAPQRAWRAYESLFCCYVQQLSQQVVADQLAMSARQQRREQQAAMELLADHLWQKLEPITQPGEQPLESSAGLPASLSPELAWLTDAPPEHPAILAEDLSAVMEFAQPLAIQNDVQLDLHAPDLLPALAVHSVALHQILLTVLSVAIPRAAHGQVRIDVCLTRWEVVMRVECAAPAQVEPATTEDDTASLAMSRQLAAISGGRLQVGNIPGQPFSATLILPALQQLPVLVVDDNADALHLLQRYTDGTRYRIVGLQDPEQALGLAETLSPQVIVLDVMMPHVYGWKVLGRLHQHPLTEQIPIIVCTILPQEKLALSLGASAFLKKPITRQVLLAALDHLIGLRLQARTLC